MAEAALAYEGCPYEAEVNTVERCVEIWQVNREYRQVDRPTDVLSFPMLEYETPSDFDHVEDMYADCFNPETGELMLGDIMISVDRAQEQAEKYGHSITRELAVFWWPTACSICADTITWRRMNAWIWNGGSGRFWKAGGYVR